jgi:phosphatidylserine/phosphatidylglycerophosphate/cardiolipin synthase-like enzyme
MKKPEIQAFANTDDILIVWFYAQEIKNCYGFALFRKMDGESESAAEPVNTWVGFEKQAHKDGEHRPSTQWPIQKYVWSDFMVKKGASISYKVVPMISEDSGNTFTKDESNSSDWSNVVTVAPLNKFEAYFNRGIISSQFLLRKLSNGDLASKKATFNETVKDPDSTIREFMGGNLASRLFDLLDEVAANKNPSIYTALYELNELILIDKLKKLGKRANIILANGAFKHKNDDPNAEPREELKNEKVNVIDRMVPLGHFAHNKFLVVCENGEPVKVWTGSLNWTEHGLYSQVNNGILINLPKVAGWYKDEWDLLADVSKKAASSDAWYPQSLMRSNSVLRKPSVANINTWFAPVNDFVDLEAANKLINAAKKGILFLFFNPGTHDTLFNTILDIQKKKPNLFIHGIINQDPGGKANPLVLYHRGEEQPVNYSTIIPKAENEDFSYWHKEIAPQMVTIHSKVVIIDPFSDNAATITGSHNLGPKASSKNDDNMNIIQNNPELATQYAVHIMSVYSHYRFRFFKSQNESAKQWSGLQRNDAWQKGYMTGEKLKEINFWLDK